MNNAISIKPTFDSLETVLLYLLEANQDVPVDPHHVISSMITDHALKFVTSDGYYKNTVKPQLPKNALFIGDFSNADRIYTTHEELLIRPAHELIGNRAEIVMYCEGSPDIRWQLWRKLESRPKGLFPTTFGDLIYYERHFRLANIFTNSYDYSINVLAWSPKANRFYSVVKSIEDAVHFKRATDECTDTFKIHASAIDDSLCSYFFHVAITGDITLTFYVDCTAVKELFKLRNGPLTTAERRRPIIHWVCEHLRKKPVNKGFAEIPEHMRGINEFDFEGFHIKITSPKEVKND